MSSESPPPSFVDAIKKTTEAIAIFIQWLAELIQRRNWFTLLLLINAVLILFFNQGSIVPKFLNIHSL